MTLLESWNKPVNGLLPWVGTYHRLRFKRDFEGGLFEDEDELLDDIEASLTNRDTGEVVPVEVEVSRCALVRCGDDVIETRVRRMTLWDVEVLHLCATPVGKNVSIAIEGPLSGQWYEFVAAPKVASDSGWVRLELAMFVGLSRTRPWAELQALGDGGD